MPAPELQNAAGPFGRLRQFVGTAPALERCDLCGRDLAAEHDHLMEPGHHRLTCVCGACAILFGAQADGRFKRVPHRVRQLDAFQMTDGQWDALRLPIDLAFFFHSSPLDRMVAYYPSPAGATESLLSLETWDDIRRDNAVLATMEPDVEALLVNRVGYGRGVAVADYFLVPVDQCFRLVGLIRTRWTGLSGGTEVWKEISAFFADLRQRSASSTRRPPHA